LLNFINLLFRELEQMQNEKRKALLEHESAKLKECDEALQREMREWKSMLMPRKQVSDLVVVCSQWCMGSFSLLYRLLACRMLVGDCCL